MPIKPQELTREGAALIPNLVSGLIWMAVAFKWVQWDDGQVAAATFFFTALATGIGLWVVRRTTTTLANPKTADGTPMEPVKPPTRGLPKGDSR